MKALTIRQPWAGAVALGWKPVENRSRCFHHRGQLLIHAGTALTADFAEAERLILDQAGQAVPILGSPREPAAWALGAIVGVVDLVDAHRCDGSCSPWAQPGLVHHQLANARPLSRPIPATGRLGLWAPTPDVLAAVREVLPR